MPTHWHAESDCMIRIRSRTIVNLLSCGVLFVFATCAIPEYVSDAPSDAGVEPSTSPVGGGSGTGATQLPGAGGTGTDVMPVGGATAGGYGGGAIGGTANATSTSAVTATGGVDVIGTSGVTGGAPATAPSSTGSTGGTQVGTGGTLAAAGGTLAAAGGTLSAVGGTLAGVGGSLVATGGTATTAVIGGNSGVGGTSTQPQTSATTSTCVDTEACGPNVSIDSNCSGKLGDGPGCLKSVAICKVTSSTCTGSGGGSYGGSTGSSCTSYQAVSGAETACASIGSNATSVARFNVFVANASNLTSTTNLMLLRNCTGNTVTIGDSCTSNDSSPLGYVSIKANGNGYTKLSTSTWCTNCSGTYYTLE